MESNILNIFNCGFGFGFMRLPYLDNGKIDFKQVEKMVDYCIKNGFNYFDTAHGYLDGESEAAIYNTLVKRYSRDKFFLTNKLTGNYFAKKEDIRRVFDEQLKVCGVDYFDLYLMHNQNSNSYPHFVKCDAFNEAIKLKEEGKIKHLGISFHDNALYLEKILNEHPEIEVVQIQFNYLDYDDPSIQSKLLYEVCKKYNKPIIVMEPIKGGTLVNLPPKANEILTDLNNGSNASYALRFIKSFDQIKMIISGMSNFDQVKDNVNTIKNYQPLNEKELNALKDVVKIFHSMHLIACTGCRYCEKGCPKNIPIPDIFACLNNLKIVARWYSQMYYSNLTKNRGKASDCIKCGLCEKSCPQKLEIRKLLVKCKEEFE